MISRRSFLKTGAAGAAIAAFNEKGIERAIAATSYVNHLNPEQVAQNEDFWFEVQQAFDVDRTLINLNNGGVSPSPRVVQAAMRRYVEFSNHAPVYTMWRQLDPQLETVRTKLARTFGCDPEEIAITRNASESLETVQFGMDLKPGDEVLTTMQDYPRMLSTWRQRERRNGIVVKKIQFPVPPKEPSELTRLFERAISPKTRVIHFCHMTNLTGQLFPVKEICELGRSRGIEVIVDGAHAFAHHAARRDDLGCDYYGVSLHKWLHAPIGTGFLYVRKSKIPAIWPMFGADESLDNNIRKFEQIGTHPSGNFLAIAEALGFYEGIGPARKEARMRYLFHRWAERLQPMKGVILRTSLDPRMSVGLANVDIEGMDLGKLGNYLLSEHRIITTPIVNDRGVNGLRITPNVYTTLSEIDTFAEVMEKVIKTGLPA